MGDQPDLALPDRVPEMEQYHDSPERVIPFALYTLCDLDEATFERHRRLCCTGCDPDDDEDYSSVRFAPRPRFVGESLRRIVDYHVELGRGGEFDPTYFIVCVYPESTSVVVVTLDDDELECKPDLLWIKMDQSGLLCVNLQISNTDWAEAQEEDLEGPTWPGDDDHDEDDHDAAAATAAADDDEDNEDDNDDADENNDDDDGDQDDYGQAPALGFHIQVYLVPGLEENPFVDKLEPLRHLKKADRSDWVCKIHRLPKSARRDPVKHAVSVHPYRCSAHPTLQKNYFIVADEPNYSEEGVAIVHIDWDGKTSGKSKEQLLDFGKSLLYQTQRAEVPETAVRAAVGTVCMLAQGYRKWQPKVKQFAIYHTNSSDADIKLATAIDPHWAKRGHGEARTAAGGFVSREETDKGDGLWPYLIERHVEYCKRQKFAPEFIRPFFIWCGDEEPSAKSEVQLVRLDWNGDFRQKESLVAEYKDKASLTNTPASKAHKQLSDVVDGISEWDGKALS
jgi:hypothetical protein